MCNLTENVVHGSLIWFKMLSYTTTDCAVGLAT